MTEFVINDTSLALQSRLDSNALALLDASGGTLEADTFCFTLDPAERAALRVLDPSSTVALQVTPTGWTRGAGYIEMLVVAPLVESVSFELRADDGTTAGKVRTMHIKTRPKGTLPADGS